jgi:hypothetical protein
MPVSMQQCVGNGIYSSMYVRGVGNGIDGSMYVPASIYVPYPM